MCPPKTLQHSQEASSGILKVHKKARCLTHRDVLGSLVFAVLGDCLLSQTVCLPLVLEVWGLGLQRWRCTRMRHGACLMREREC